METEEIELPDTPKAAPDIDAMRFLLGRIKNAARPPVDNPEGTFEDLDERQQALETELGLLLNDTDINSSPEAQALAVEMYLSQFLMLEISSREVADYQASQGVVKALLAAIKQGRCRIRLVEPSRYYAPEGMRDKITVVVDSMEIDNSDSFEILLHGKKSSSDEPIDIRLSPFSIGRDIQLLT
ncbi:MAG TPA: hypothetical protein PL051_02605 [Candidatus Saccharibacteria bacterium]|nr:hypothetical protein [Candidatus Saccharibacteria bacterium]